MKKHGVWVLAVLMAGCFRAQAKTVPVAPLDVPEPPARVVEATDPEIPPLIGLPDEPTQGIPSRPRPTPTQRTEGPRPAEPSKSEPAAEAAKPEETLKLPTLQTTSADQEGEVERQIRTLLARATGNLNRVNYQALSSDGRVQYDTAKRFVNQAEDAIRAKNLVFANNLADKAAALAAELAGR